MKDRKPFEERTIGKILMGKGLKNVADVLSKLGIPVVSQGAAAVGMAIEAIQGSDELTKEEKEQALEVLTLELQEYDLMLKDSANAREHDIRIQESENSSFLSKNVSYWIDLLIVAATIGIIYMLLFRDIPLTNKEMFYIAAGALMNMTSTIISFHRGSTAKSQQKDKAIQELVGK